MLYEDNWNNFELQAMQRVSHGRAKTTSQTWEGFWDDTVLSHKASMPPSTAHDIGTLVHNLAKIFKIHLLLTHKKNLLWPCCCHDPLAAQMQWHEETTVLNRMKTLGFGCSVNVYTVCPEPVEHKAQ